MGRIPKSRSKFQISAVSEQDKHKQTETHPNSRTFLCSAENQLALSPLPKGSTWRSTSTAKFPHFEREREKMGVLNTTKSHHWAD